jgi:cellulose synthase/poly-beta-1,6-N-acetylglucosamine synthase-like glycosyltransferase
MRTTITVIIPARDSGVHLASCLGALRESSYAPLEVIVVDDGSKDDTTAVAGQFGAKVLCNRRSMGPAFARNLGAKAAAGEVLFFLDSDVCVNADTLRKVSESFHDDPGLDALMGSYDNNPSSPDFISQYRNLMHSYVHQTSAENASTFWSGCGAIRRDLFLEHAGFNEEYGRPAIEDIELGYRLIHAKRKIVLDRSILVTHLKLWTFWSLVRTDILDRGIPWTELILRDRFMPNDLNLQLSQRVSVALVFILVALAGVTAVVGGSYVLIPFLVVIFLMLARWWGEIGSYKRPRIAYTALTCTLALIMLIAYWQKMFALIPFLAVMPVLLLLRHRYNRQGRLTKSHRWLGILFICASVVAAALYLPAHHLILACFAILLLLGLLNSQFYIFLAGQRGIAFMLAAIPFHLLYHFYNGISFIAGIGRHLVAPGPLKKTAARSSTSDSPR